MSVTGDRPQPVHDLDGLAEQLVELGVLRIEWGWT